MLLALVAAPQAGVAQTPVADPIDLFGSFAPLSTKLDGTNRTYYDAAARKYVFLYEENGAVLRRYEIDVGDPFVQNGVITIYEAVSDTYPVVEGGLSYRQPRSIGGSLNPRGLTFQAELGKTRTFVHSLLPGNVVVMRYDEIVNGIPLAKRYVYEPRGKTLVIRVDSGGAPQANHYGNYRGFSFNKNANLINPRDLMVTYAETAPVIVAGPTDDRCFITTYIDWTRSGHNAGAGIEEVFSGSTHLRAHRTRYVGDGSTHRPVIADFMPPVRETVYVTVSSSVQEVLPTLHRPATRFRNDLSRRMWLDLWRLHTSGGVEPLAGIIPGVEVTDLPFEKIGAILDYLRGLGMEDLMVNVVLWQQLYDRTRCVSLRPHLYPPNPKWGGTAELRRVRDEATRRGDLFAVYQNYTSMFDTPGNPPGPQWDPSKLTVSSTGDFLNVEPSSCSNWLYGPLPLEISPDHWLSYAQRESPLLEQELDPTATYLDVHPKALWYNKIDYRSGSKTRCFADVHRRIADLLRYQRATFRGPVLGEGGSTERVQGDTLHGGLVDAFYGETANNNASPVIPDVELRQFKPVMTRAGMGFWNRWVGKPTQGIDFDFYDFDHWYATSIAFGHSGFLTDHTLSLDPRWGANLSFKEKLLKDHLEQFVRTYYLFKDLQQQYLTAAVDEVSYFDTASQSFYDLGRAIDVFPESYFDNPLLKTTYDNGLEVHVNRRQSGPVWAVAAADGNTYYLPPNGWVAVNPSLGFVTFSGLADDKARPAAGGYRIDYVRSRNYLFVDPRGRTVDLVDGLNGCANIPASRITAVKADGLIVLQQPDRTYDTGTMAPCFAGVSSAVVKPGQLVIVRGAFLPTNLEVYLGGTLMQVTQQNNTTIAVRVPRNWSELGRIPLEVRNGRGQVIESYSLLVQPLAGGLTGGVR